MAVTIALAGNPNSGKTTLFNALTGSNQYVGNWPGVTVEKKEGKLRKAKEVTLTDLPGIYSLSPYTLEEVVARNYLLESEPDAILNIVDGTNLERNLYLTTQLLELGIPVVVAVNMMDIVRKNGDKLNIKALSEALGCPMVEISALRGTGIDKAANLAIEAANGAHHIPHHAFSGAVEHALAHIEETALSAIPEEKKRFYAIKLFERDDKSLEKCNLSDVTREQLEREIQKAETECDDDSESIITNERYIYIASILKGTYKKKQAGKLTVSDKIDRVVTNRWAALPIFAVIMFLVYFVSWTTVGTWVTDFTNDALFGDGFHLFGIGTKQYEEEMNAYAGETIFTDPFLQNLQLATDAQVIGADEMLEAAESGEYADFEEAFGTYGAALDEAGYPVTAHVETALEAAPSTEAYGVWVPGIPVLATKGLEKMHCAGWLQSLLVDGVIGGVGAVLGFVPQMMLLFIALAFLEGCGYMARVAFVLDRIFRKFGLSGKSFIPMLIGTGCGVPGIMASRTIENERDRRMTVVTTTFIPCGAKLPIVAMIAAALFGNAWWVAPSAYFIGMAAIVISGICLKKTKLFSGTPAPFVMELPAYHLPTASNVFHSMWERASSFIKRAGTVILLSSILIWAGSSLGVVNGAFTFDPDMELELSFLGRFGAFVAPIFAPLGFANIKATVATIMGLVAKEEVVAVFGVLDFEGMTKLAAYSFLVFNLLCAPCFAAMGAIRREMNSAKWTSFAIGYQTLFAYAVSLIIFQIGSAVTGQLHVAGLLVALALVALFLYMLFKPYKEASTLKTNSKHLTSKGA